MKNPLVLLILILVGMVVLFAGGFYGGMTLVVENQKKKVFHQEVKDLLPLPIIKKEPETLEEKFSELKGVSQELDAWRGDVAKEKEHLIQLDTDIQRRESLLKAERESLDKEREKIQQMQKDLESQILKVEDNEDAALKELAGLFAKMKADDVVAFLRMFPEDQTTRLMTYMPKRQLVKVLELWNRNYPNDRQRLMRVTSETRRVVKDNNP